MSSEPIVVVVSSPTTIQDVGFGLGHDIITIAARGLPSWHILFITIIYYLFVFACLFRVVV